MDKVTNRADIMAHGDSYASGYISNVNSREVSMVTVNSITVGNVVYKPHWETEGLCVPIVFNTNGNNQAAYVRIPRDELIKMLKDIQEQLSHE